MNTSAFRCVAACAVGVSALLGAPPARAQDVVQAGSSVVDPTDLGRAEEFLSPALLEELSVRLWDLEDETYTPDVWWIPRRAAALHAFYGVGRSHDIGWHQVIGGAISLRLSWWGRYTKKPKLLARRFEWLERQHATHLKQILGQECARTKQAVKDYASKLTQTQLDLQTLKQEPAKLAIEPHYPNNRHPYARTCAWPSLNAAVEAGPPTKDPKDGASSTAASPEQRVDSRQVAFLREVEADLIARLAAAQADLSFIISTDINSGDTVERARKVVMESQRFFVPHIEGLLGYTFQLSQGGLARDLGGVTGALGLGIAPVSLGVFFSQPRVVGIYFSLSAEVIN